MSEFMVCKSQISDFDCLKDALVDIGVPLISIKEFDKPQEMRGYHRSEVADVVISRDVFGSSHDVGFKYSEDGTYDILVYDGDLRTAGRLMPITRGGTGELIQHYTKHVILKTAKRKGHTAKATIKDGKIKIKVSV